MRPTVSFLRCFFDQRSLHHPVRPSVLLAVAVGTYGILLSGVTWLKYRYYLYDDFDLAAWSQVLWNTLHGHFFYLSIRDIVWFYHLPVLALFLLPLYVLWSHPWVLLLVLSFGLAFGALPVYRLASSELGSPWGLRWALLYLCYPPIAAINLFEFHPDGLTIPCWIGAVYALRKNRLGLFLVCLTIALSCKELFLIPVTMFSLYAVCERKSFSWWGCPLLLCALWYLIGVKLVVPRITTASLSYGQFFSQWGTSPARIVSMLVRHPGALLAIAYPWEKLQYLRNLLVPLLFLPLADPTALLIPFPMLLLSLLSSFPGLFSTSTHYAASIAPFLIAAGILGMRRLQRAAWRCRWPSWIPSVVFGGSLALSVAMNPVWPLLLAELPTARRDPSTVVRDAMVAAIPATAPCVATFQFLPRLSSRYRLYSLHYLYLGKDNYTGQPYQFPVLPDYALIDVNDPLTFTGFFNRQGAERLRQFFGTGEWSLEDIAGTVMLWQRGGLARKTFIHLGASQAPSGAPVISLFDQVMELQRPEARLESSRFGPLLHLRMTWKLLVQQGTKYAVVFVVRDQAGRVLTKFAQDVGYEFLPTNEWPQGIGVQTDHWLPVPESGAATGPWRLDVALVDSLKKRVASAHVTDSRQAGSADGWVTVLLAFEHS